MFQSLRKGAIYRCTALDVLSARRYSSNRLWERMTSFKPLARNANRFTLNVNASSFNRTRAQPHSSIRSTTSSMFGDRSGLYSFLGPQTLIYLIIGANVGVWATWKQVEQSGSRKYTQFMLNNFTTSPNSVFSEYRIHTLLSCAYSHASGWHLFGNMVTLYFFGNTVLAVLGPSKFLMFYNSSAVVASLAQVACGSFDTSWVRSWWGSSDMHTRSLGASGAISAIVMTSIALFPKQVVYFYGFIPIPATVFGVGFVLKDLLGLADNSSSIGHAAHLGGAACGLLYGLATVWQIRRGKFRGGR